MKKFLINLITHLGTKRSPGADLLRLIFKLHELQLDVEVAINWWQPSEFKVDYNCFKRMEEFSLAAEFQIDKVTVNLINYLSDRDKSTHTVPLPETQLKYGYKCIALTDKHIHAWRRLLESDASYSIILEDDALLASGWSNRLEKVYRLLSDDEQIRFADLCAHFQVQEMYPTNLPIEIYREDLGSVYERFVPNTTAAYLITKYWAAEALKVVVSQPHFRVLPIGWLMNCIRLMTDPPMRGLHIDEGIFINQSLRDGIIYIT